ncbi:unnamed protein product [Chrysodeixis includens]|uniref:Uncharacterized protein n=1 Tax=Chrysodeixis includens TaxID=689277 RepID=A0A9N8KWA9_CHRIL|nr:unnamed protein product [Chrysodeixis includens]
MTTDDRSRTREYRSHNDVTVALTLVNYLLFSVLLLYYMLKPILRVISTADGSPRGPDARQRYRSNLGLAPHTCVCVCVYSHATRAAVTRAVLAGALALVPVDSRTDMCL